jgi:hypothetical protein
MMAIVALIALALLAGTLIGNAPAHPNTLPADTVAQTTTPPGTQTTTAPPTSGQEDCGCGVPANPRGPR